MVKAMSLRQKMTLWYTLLSVVTAAIFAGTLYWITSAVLAEMLQREADLSVQQLSAQVEFEHGMLTFENEVPLSTGSMYYIMEENGSELASYGKDISLFDNVPIMAGSYRRVQSGNEEWLLLDSQPFTVEHFTVRVRVAVSTAVEHRVLSVLLLVFGIGIPAIAALSLLGGYGIANRSLKPIRDYPQRRHHFGGQPERADPADNGAG